MSTMTRKASPRPPARSAIQRQEALDRANEIRSGRAEFKRDLKSGRTTITSVLLDPPELLASMKVFDLLMAVPKFGQSRVLRALGACKISLSKTVGGMTTRQRLGLVSEFLRIEQGAPRRPQRTLQNDVEVLRCLIGAGGTALTSEMDVFARSVAPGSTMAALARRGLVTYLESPSVGAAGRWQITDIGRQLAA